MEDSKRKEHRLRSASATFQKGLYHLYVLKNEKACDAFDAVLRIYQSVFLLGITQMLLDLEGTVIDPEKMRFANKDPAAGIQHSMVKDWSGFEPGHPLYEVSQRTRILFRRTIDARHNLIYRPLYLNTSRGWHWEDCTLKELLKDIPTIEEVEEVYKGFFEAIEIWEAKVTSDEQSLPPFFLKTYILQKFSNSNKTVLAAYTHLLNPNDHELEEQTEEFSAQLLGGKIKK